MRFCQKITVIGLVAVGGLAVTARPCWAHDHEPYDDAEPGPAWGPTSEFSGNMAWFRPAMGHGGTDEMSISRPDDIDHLMVSCPNGASVYEVKLWMPKGTGAIGDLDMEVLTVDGFYMGIGSYTSADVEVVTVPVNARRQVMMVHIWGYQGRTNSYTVSMECR